MNKKSKDLKKIYEKLLSFYGPRKWWPARTRLEVIISAILTQNVTWRNAKKAMESLRRRKLLTVEKLQRTPASKIAPLIRPSRFYNQKADKIKAFISYLITNYDGSLDRMFSEDIDSLRKELLSIKGIGKETADCILLYAGDKLSFVSDAYTKRFITRFGLMNGEPSYDEIRAYFTERIPADVNIYNEFHALIVHHGYAVCKAQPACEICPVKMINRDFYCLSGQTSRRRS